MEFPGRNKGNETFHIGTARLTLLLFFSAWLVLALRLYQASWNHR